METGNKTFNETFNKTYEVSSEVVKRRVLDLKPVLRW